MVFFADLRGGSRNDELNHPDHSNVKHKLYSCELILGEIAYRKSSFKGSILAHKPDVFVFMLFPISY